jgi:hypothetical protein
VSRGHQGHPLSRRGAHEDSDDAGGEQAAPHAAFALYPRHPGAARHRRGGHALNPRGEFYSTENIQERLALRNYLDELRGSGERTGGPAALDHTDRKRFADQLDRFLGRKLAGEPKKD